MSPRSLIVIIEDDPTLGRSLEQRFLLEGYAVRWAKTAREGLAALDQDGVRMVLSDIRLPDGTGEEVVTAAFSRNSAVPTIFMTAYGDIEQAVRLIKLGARDYIAKPFDVDELVERIRTLVGPDDQEGRDPFATFGVSPAMLDIRRMLDKLARSDLPVLLTGETGTGKEIAARYLHARSVDATADAGPAPGDDADLPFVAVNCAAIPSDLFESSMFGHERGAFSGAVDRQIGFAEQAGRGTLFLDEVGELDLALQAKLLRLVQTRAFQRLGGARTLACEARFVFATNRELTADVAAGRFREDLLFRINAVECRLPPLRDRTGEIADLMRHFLDRAARRHRWAEPRLDPAVLELAAEYAWRGNVRELENRVERAVALREGEALTVADLWPDRVAAESGTPASGSPETLAEARELAEKSRIEAALRSQGGRLAETARVLAISRTTLWHKIQKYSLDVAPDED